MIWRIVILFFLISTSLSAQRIIPAKVPLSYSWALNANPMRDYLEVRLDETHFIQWEMMDAQGRVVLKNIITQPHIHIQTTSLSEGNIT